MNNLNNELMIKNNNNLTNEVEQNKFLESTLGKTINTGIDIGIRTLLPDYIEGQVIDIKNNLINYGLKDGIKKSINDAIDLGKSAIGIVTGNFENINQVKQAVKSGGLIDNVSNLLDDVIGTVNSKGLINNNVATTIRQGKNIILNNVEKNIENTFMSQLDALNKTEKYINNWKNYFSNKDFEGMQREYYKIQQQIKELIPIEKTINDVKTLKNLHNLIKNNGQNFDLTQQELELAEKLK